MLARSRSWKMLREIKRFGRLYLPGRRHSSQSFANKTFQISTPPPTHTHIPTRKSPQDAIGCVFVRDKGSLATAQELRGTNTGTACSDRQHHWLERETEREINKERQRQRDGELPMYHLLLFLFKYKSAALQVTRLLRLSECRARSRGDKTLCFWHQIVLSF